MEVEDGFRNLRNHRYRNARRGVELSSPDRHGRMLASLAPGTWLFGGQRTAAVPGSLAA